MTSNKNITTIDQYIRSFPADVQKALRQIRQAIREAAPTAEEKISYHMPTYTLNGKYLIYFAGWKSHIGFYPMSSAVKEFKKELSKYKGAKGSVQFPLDQPMPLALVRRIVKYRVKEREAQMKPKSTSKSVSDLPDGLSAPALRALRQAKITSLSKLAQYREADILKLHGLGPASLPKLRAALKAQKLAFKK